MLIFSTASRRAQCNITLLSFDCASVTNEQVPHGNQTIRPFHKVQRLKQSINLSDSFKVTAVDSLWFFVLFLSVADYLLACYISKYVKLIRSNHVTPLFNFQISVY